MSSPSPDMQYLERVWHQRLSDAKLRLDFARNYVHEIQADLESGSGPGEMEHFAYEKAVGGENFAFAEYNRVLRIYGDLTVKGIIPDETAWLKAQAANASGTEFE